MGMKEAYQEKTEAQLKELNAQIESVVVLCYTIIDG
jgi:hypothetical protein